MKKHSFGVGKWNGYGGKLEKGEEPIQGIVREVSEESNLNIEPNKFKELGFMDFFFDDKPEWDQHVVVYRVDDFEGAPEETEEMMPKWFDLNEIPWSEMWKGDDQWLPYVIENKKFSGEIHFVEEGQKLVSFKIDNLKINEGDLKMKVK